MDKNTLYGLAGMLVGGVIVVTGLLKIAVLPVLLILVGGAIGFAGYRIYIRDIVL